MRIGSTETRCVRRRPFQVLGWNELGISLRFKVPVSYGPAAREPVCKMQREAAVCKAALGWLTSGPVPHAALMRRRCSLLLYVMLLNQQGFLLCEWSGVPLCYGASLCKVRKLDGGQGEALRVGTGWMDCAVLDPLHDVAQRGRGWAQEKDDKAEAKQYIMRTWCKPCNAVCTLCGARLKQNQCAEGTRWCGSSQCQSQPAAAYTQRRAPCAPLNQPSCSTVAWCMWWNVLR